MPALEPTCTEVAWSQCAQAMAAKAKEIAGLEAELAGKDAAIGSLLQERTALEARVEAERAVGEKRERATRLEMEAALRSKDEDKENAMLHQASLRQAQAEAHLQETAALAAEAALRERRQGGAFAAARSLLALRMEDLAKDMKTLQVCEGDSFAALRTAQQLVAPNSSNPSQQELT
jgi:hypothetical protein